jgi:hypothetical protein
MRSKRNRIMPPGAHTLERRALDAIDEGPIWGRRLELDLGQLLARDPGGDARQILARGTCP